VKSASSKMALLDVAIIPDVSVSPLTWPAFLGRAFHTSS
jgi:hypothetical protein